ncbi:outer surface protein OspD [Borreliella burgdorferi]|uniref:outer surface protein OspD n=2 Tax=Borreliella burgdorferi TaxID=139 RepID=UPI00017F4756|nr:outer surface protein OspD [Borreliella burgdorferi]ACO38188.1 outer surface protein D [Borreliella burgdorferi 29805]MCD2372788.1 outer surface protein OspD [Borreliella burgdorferi]MCD2376782.1 outer surface protein OspD [Borreliella burgdorferi]MCD2388683.1 outer surface protein OspD [Borreliella burgdorferi]MCD2392390.1 outer surface protein OspD [Borreliella burgdorferi]
MKKLIKILLLSLFLLLSISCVHDKQELSSKSNLNNQKGYLDNEGANSNYESKKQSILSELNQLLKQTTNSLKEAKNTTDNLNASNEANKVVEAVINAVNLISSAADQVKSATKNMHDLAQMAEIDLEKIKNSSDKAIFASNVAKEAYSLTKAAEQNMQKLYKEQQKISESESDYSDSAEIKQAKEAVEIAWKATVEAKDKLIDVENTVKETLDKIKTETTNNTKLADIKEAAELVLQIAKNAKEIVQEVVALLNT